MIQINAKELHRFSLVTIELHCNAFANFSVAKMLAQEIWKQSTLQKNYFSKYLIDKYALLILIIVPYYA